MTAGFTLGKFAPLHKGHQFLIESALANVDRLVVVIYACDELPQCDVRTRASWIARLYPQVDLVLASNGPKETGYTPEIIASQEQYLLGLLAEYRFDSFFSSEPYGEHISKAFSCRNVQVDCNRLQVPISASMIRDNLPRYQDFLSPLVFNDLMNARAITLFKHKVES